MFNAGYNPSGKVTAAQYRFPYEDESFDFVFLTSVFTHMLPEDLEHYLSETARVMKRNARCLITFFLLNAESLRLIEAGKSSQDFRHVIGKCRTVDPSQPESSLAYDEAHVRELFVRYGLHIGEPIHFGAWCGREKHLSYHDVVIARKAGTDSIRARV